MIKDILLLSVVLCAIAMVGIFLNALMRAPEGTEDEAGFHFLKKRTPVSRPPFTPMSSRQRAKKNESPARHRISAA